MAKPKKLKSAAQMPAYVPQDQDEVASAIDQIGRLQREISGTQSEMNDQIADITERYAGSITAKTDELKRLQTGVQSWCEANRDALTNHGKRKSAGFTTGEIQWRQRPPSVSVRGVEDVIDRLLSGGLGRFVREKYEINKDAILNEQSAVAGVPGITIKTGIEDFVITPFEQELA